VNCPMEPGRLLEFYGYSLAYFDTNVYGSLVRTPAAWIPVRNFLIDNNYLLAVSDVNALELSSAPRLHRNLARFLLQVPSTWFKPATKIMEDEVQAYLSGGEVNPVVGPITSLILESHDPVGSLEAFFRREVVRETRSTMVQRKAAFVKRIIETRDNFQPIVHPGRYTEADAPYYDFQLSWLQTLCQDWPECAARIKDELGTPPKTPPSLPLQFRGLWLFALSQFYRYYLHQRKPAGNDYGDLIQAASIPYCRFVVVEKDLSEDLLHIKRNDPVLKHTEIHNFGFLRELTGLSLA
jgi:hypothetical protein